MQTTIRFGVFEVDLRAGELRKQGIKVKLQEQPLQVLQILLENPGEVVTREELQQKSGPPTPLSISITVSTTPSDVFEKHWRTRQRLPTTSRPWLGVDIGS